MSQPVRSNSKRSADATPAPALPKYIKIADASFGLSLVDPLSGAVYTHTPTTITERTTWLDAYVKLGILVEI